VAGGCGGFYVVCVAFGGVCHRRRWRLLRWALAWRQPVPRQNRRLRLRTVISAILSASAMGSCAYCDCLSLAIALLQVSLSSAYAYGAWVSHEWLKLVPSHEWHVSLEWH
jgi:hypothetical protein